MQELVAIAERIAARLKARGETLAVAESSAGGLVSAALLAVPGASAYMVGGGVFYTRQALLALRDTDERLFAGLRGATEEWALLMARTVRERSRATWGLGESGAAGPTGNRYGDPPGHCCVAVAGPLERSARLATGSADRTANMRAFAAAALELLAQALG